MLFALFGEYLYFCGVMKGLVIKNTGSCYVVKTEGGECVSCKIKGNFRLRGIRTTNPVAVGDIVEISAAAPDGTAYITSIDTRRNYIIRRASNLSKESHIIAANIDLAFLIVTIKEPETSTTFIDRFLATTEAYGIKAVIIINKIDLLDEEESEYAGALNFLYTSIGYDVIMMSALNDNADDNGIDRILELTSGHISLFSGNSGVGKSTIINLLIPDARLKVGNISATHHTGMHTTTFSEMLPLPCGGYLIDTPGIKGFGTIDFDKSQVAHYFPEIFKASAGCRYHNCTHTHEPGCAVLSAVEDCLISRSRYTSYLSILDDATDPKYRKAY